MTPGPEQRVHPRAAGPSFALSRGLLAILALFLFTLPLVEAPKNVALGLYIAVWAVRAVATRDVGGRWDLFDTAFLAVLASAVLSGLAGYAGDIADVVRVMGFGWLVKRSALTPKEVPVLAGFACLGLAIAITIGAVPFFSGARLYLELPSVGQVNQSALYIAILTAAAFGWWMQGARAYKRGWHRRLPGVFAILFAAAVLVGASRAAILAAGCAAAAITLGVLGGGIFAYGKRILRQAAIAVAVLLALVAGLTAVAPELSDRKLVPERLLTTYSTASRLQHWRIAVEGWRQRPWIGWGPDSFQRLKIDDVCKWRADRGESCDRSIYTTTKHAHSLYVATLAERGLVGLAALLLLLGAWSYALLRDLRAAPRSRLWVASAAGFLVVVVGGVFNTTLRVEHGSLAVVWLGLWLAARRAEAGFRPAA